MINRAYNLFRLLRPRQWVKNFAIFASIVFNGALFNPLVFSHVFLGFIIFCLLSSAVYIINDLFDIKKDRMHPFKRFRPLAHGNVSISLAVGTALVFILVSFILAAFINTGFLFVGIIYLLLQLSYSAVFKHIAVIDILSIASGYILRVYAGEFASGYHISVWLLLTAISISLFIAVAKRRSELTLISGYNDTQKAAVRKTLSHYSERLLDVYASMFATSTFISYTLFTFLQHPSGFKPTLDVLMTDFLPEFLQRKWLMITILPVVFGLMRYLQDIYEKHEGESPEKVLFSDKPLLISVATWMILVIFVEYVIGG